MQVYTCMHAYKYIDGCMHVCVHMHVSIWQVCMQVHTCMYVEYMHVHLVHASSDVCMYACMYVGVYVGVYACIGVMPNSAMHV